MEYLNWPHPLRYDYVLSLLTRFRNSVAVEQRYEQFFADGSSMVGGLNLHPSGNYDFHYGSTVSA